MPFICRSACPFCGQKQAKSLTAISFDDPKMVRFLESYFSGRVDRQLLMGGQYEIAGCSTCGGMWQAEILDETGMELLYGQWIESKGSADKRKSPSFITLNARHAARLLRLFPQPHEALLLDYGMGWGDWCQMMQAFGFRTIGVELSQERIAAAKAKGIEACLPTDIPPGPYDFIYLEQVLEHIPDPRGTMTTLVELLKPGGYVHIGVPNGLKQMQYVSSQPEKLLTKGPFQPLEHINISTPKSLRYFMKSLGCEPAAQREGLMRASSLSAFVQDLILAVARFLPPSVFPPGTSVMFRKVAR